MKNKLQFNCGCNGCRNYPTNPTQVYDVTMLTGKEQETKFFHISNMKLFKTKLIDWININDKDVLILTSSIHGWDGAVRYYEIVRMCKFGKVDRNLGKFTNIKTARKAFNDELISEFLPCDCHGCQLDRAGRE